MTGARNILLSALLSVLPLAAFADEASNCIPVSTKYEADAAYTAGEKLGFVIHYKFGLINSDIGTAGVTLDTVRVGGRKCFVTRVTGATSKFFDRIFKVREDFSSWFTCDGLQPVRFTRDTHEGGYTAQDDYHYMWDASPSPYIDATIYTTSFGTTKQMQLPLKPCTFDLPALFFYARNIDMSRVKVNVKYPMTFAIDDDIFDVYFIYRGKVTKKVKGLGTIRCMRFGAKLLEGAVFKGDEDLDIYISDDGNRLPVLFGAPIWVGEVEGRMTSYSGLKYPFSAKVK